MAGDDAETGPHPRHRYDFFGHERAEAAFAEAIASGRLHHAWLIGGPEGVGKATLAYRVARRLLASPEERGEGIAVDPASRTARQIEAGAHPNLAVLDLERAAADVDKPPARTIPVRTVRRALSFFAATAADGGRRVCIIDAAEDLLPAAANALLKTVEEPPAGAVILIVSHAPQRLLPTIRSRCRKLTLGPLAEADVLAVLRTLPSDAVPGDGAAMTKAAAQAEGSVRRALSLLDPKRLAIATETVSILELMPYPPLARVLALAEKVGDRRAGPGFELALDAVQRWAGEQIRSRAALGPARLAPLAALCDKIDESARSVETYNLDRRPFIVTLFTDLAEAVGRAA